ncbi:SNED1-like protein [Mya arenaria]|uniref:SNED1-like protein n=1 Tax=Mya arenaria TaxID=6604 RepID=A0ABY7E6F7_MYAAR|nr:fibropellin-3-like [Mya arenaria]WAR04377.1 SNED1-like protein [Mya arenaria]
MELKLAFLCFVLCFRDVSTAVIGDHCGTLTSPSNGVVTYTSTIQDSVATYNCDTGFAIDGVTTRTCSAVTPKVWSDTAPTCIEVTLGLDCTADVTLCTGIANSECSDGQCQCVSGYVAGDASTCNDIDECASMPCLNGATCMNDVDMYTCTCAAGYHGVNCDSSAQIGITSVLKYLT